MNNSKAAIDRNRSLGQVPVATSSQVFINTKCIFLQKWAFTEVMKNGSPAERRQTLFGKLVNESSNPGAAYAEANVDQENKRAKSSWKAQQLDSAAGLARAGQLHPVNT